MNRRDFITTVASAYGVALVAPRTPAGDIDYVAQVEAARTAGGEAVKVVVALVDADGVEHLPKEVTFAAEHSKDAYGEDVVTFRPTDLILTWPAVLVPLEVHSIVAHIPVGGTTHRVRFPLSYPVVANGGDINVANLKTVLR